MIFNMEKALFVWALDSEIQLWVGPCCGVQPLAQGVGVFVTPLLPHLQRERVLREFLWQVQS